MPVLEGKLRNSSIAASNPPADPPMPTIGQAESFGFARVGRRPDFDCADFLRLGFIREGDALCLGFRFAFMAVVHVSGRPLVIQPSIADGAAVVFGAERIGLLSRRSQITERMQKIRRSESAATKDRRSGQGQCLGSRRRRPHSVQTFLNQIALDLPVFERGKQKPVRLVNIERVIDRTRVPFRIRGSFQFAS
jgi:hypothetical protein